MNLLLVEDDAELATALAAELRGVGHSVEWVANGRDALTSVDRDQFDVILLDRMMPRLDGIAMLERLRASARTLPVIILSALGQTDDRIEGLVAGADDYMVKPVQVAELDARLHAVIRGRQWPKASADTVRAGDIVVNPDTFRAWRDEKPLDLVKLELKLLTEFVRNPDIVLTRAMLIKRVWGYDFEPDTNLVDVYIRRLRQKLTAHGGTDPIVTMRGVGYMLRG